jgi:heat shock protein HslJ
VGFGAPVTETVKNYALYVQDDWKVTPRLTVNLGMRWEYEGGITDRFNAISNFDPDVRTSLNGLSLRGGLAPRRIFREADGDRLVAADGTELVRTAKPDMIDDRFELSGLYRDTPSGGMFAECLSGRTYTIAPGGAEPDLEKAWTEAAPSREASLFVRLQGSFRDNELHAERLIALDANGTCPPLAARGSALRDTEWRVVEIDGDRPTFASRRQQPTLRLDSLGKYTATTGCNAVAGTYRLDPEGLSFVAEATPPVAQCPVDVGAIERRFLDALASVRQAQLSGTTLDLMDQTNKRRLRLEARGR